MFYPFSLSLFPPLLSCINLVSEQTSFQPASSIFQAKQKIQKKKKSSSPTPVLPLIKPPTKSNHTQNHHDSAPYRYHSSHSLTSHHHLQPKAPVCPEPSPNQRSRCRVNHRRPTSTVSTTPKLWFTPPAPCAASQSPSADCEPLHAAFLD